MKFLLTHDLHDYTTNEGEQYGRRQWLEWHLSCHRPLQLAVVSPSRLPLEPSPQNVRYSEESPKAILKTIDTQGLDIIMSI